MNARNLWRVRLILFLAIFLIGVFAPFYYLEFYEGDGEWVFLWGHYCSGCYTSPLTPESMLSIAFMFLSQAIAPSTIFVIGIAGCTLTNRSFIKSGKVSKTARVLTQISVTASLFLAISPAFTSLMRYMFNWIASLMDFGSFGYTLIYISALCILPIALFLAYISYDFPRFRALDFAQEEKSKERAPEELKSLSLK